MSDGKSDGKTFVAIVALVVLGVLGLVALVGPRRLSWAWGEQKVEIQGGAASSPRSW